MDIREALNPAEWDAFLAEQQFRPFLQSWTMGEVYKRTNQEPIRIEVRDGAEIVGICMVLVIPARRGRHLSVPYGPILKNSEVLPLLIEELKRKAQEHTCSFIRMSPFWKAGTEPVIQGTKRSPLHLLAEHIWYVPLRKTDSWETGSFEQSEPRQSEEILMEMRKTTRNLVRRAEKEDVEVMASPDPVRDLEIFLKLHDETRKRHSFTPYSTAFFRAQVEEFSKRNECSLYLARHQGEVLACSIHMHAFGETSYHHGASRQTQIPASYLLQWKAMTDALERGDYVYNFWGVSPEGAIKHPFAGVRTFKTGFGGKLLELTPCFDIPMSGSYHLTRGFEMLRKWRRGF